MTNEKSILAEALARPEPAERRLYLDNACLDDAAMRLRVEAFLEAHHDDGLLDAAAHGLDNADAIAPTIDVTRPPIAEGPGTRIGPYKLLQKIGEGGMGVVFMAEQETPVRRKVALKVIKPGMDTNQVVARFQAERQALAIMDHPNIARVLDAGATDTGRPFFVMELVKGVPITEYCDQTSLTPRERLELFIPVCQAIQHAHQKGIIHRDVKPSNVLITLHDGVPLPKVIDFGVAKAIDQRLTEQTLFTEFGAVIGTLEYMSPEQAEMGALDIDTRSDIYSLGVLLYELLTGSTPLEKAKLRNAAYAEVLRRIREEEPTNPSTRLSESKDALASISAQRKMEPGRLTKLVRGELDWIVMKALEKDRTRRYETATGFAKDIQRYLADEPLEASPPSARYRLGKFVRKHRHGLATASAFAALLVAGLAISAWLAIQERASRRTAQARLGQVEKANDLLASIFQDLDPNAEEKEGKPLREILGDRLDRAAEQLDGRAIADPLTVAKLQGVLGQTQIGLGHPARAIEILTKSLATRESALGAGHPDTLISRDNLAEAYRHAGRTAEAITMHETTLKLRESRLGADHRDTLSSRNNLAVAYQTAGRTAEAIAIFEATRDLCEAKLGSDHPITISTRNNLANAYQAAGSTAKAIAILEANFKDLMAKLGADHPKTLINRNSLAGAYEAAGRVAEAIAMHEANLKVSEAKLGEDHPDTLTNRNNLAADYQAVGRTAEAIEMKERNLKLTEAKLGADHPHSLSSRDNLAVAYYHAGRTAEMIALLEPLLKLTESKLGANHADTLVTRSNLAAGYQAAGRTAEAITMLEANLKVRKAKLGVDHPSTLTNCNNLAVAYQAAGRTAEAIAMHEVTLKLRESKLGADHPDTLISRINLGAAYQTAGRSAEAIAMLKVTIELCESKLGADHPNSLRSRHNLAEMYIAAKQFARAEPLLRDLLGSARKSLGPADPRLAGRMAQLGGCLIDQGKWTEAEPVLRDCLAIREKAQPHDWSSFNTRSMLGGSLLGQGKHADAEPLIVSGYEGMKAREAKIPPPAKKNLSEAAERVVRLYGSWAKPEKAAEWMAKLAADLPRGPDHGFPAAPFARP